MTPITVYKEDIENAIEKLNGSTVNGIIRAINILQNALLVSAAFEPCINTSEFYSKETISQELNNKYAIIEILNMLMEHGDIPSLTLDNNNVFYKGKQLETSDDVWKMLKLRESAKILKANLTGN